MAHGRRWSTRAGVWAGAGALLAAMVAATASGVGDGGGPDRGASGAAAAGVPAKAAARAAADALSDASALPPMGAFTDSGAAGVAALGDLRTWLGGTPVQVGHTYLPGYSWRAIEGEDALLRPWADWRRAAPGRLFVLNVPMQQDDEGKVPDSKVRGLIRQGARGADDAHFTALARRLVGLGVPDTVIVLGWEMNGITYTHRCGPDPADWKRYWNRIVAAMRAVPGQRFRFDFAPSRGLDDVPWTSCYPGDRTVDVIGMDSYDQPTGEPFTEQVSEPYGLQRQVDFAAAHRKPVSYPEWGLFTNGDDPDYVSLMLAWIVAHHPLYQTVTDYCPHGIRLCKQNPMASAVYRALLYGRTTAPVQGVSSAAGAGGSGGGWSNGSMLTDRGGGVEACVPMPLSHAQQLDFADGEVCVRLRTRQPVPPAAQATMPPTQVPDRAPGRPVA